MARTLGLPKHTADKDLNQLAGIMEHSHEDYWLDFGRKSVICFLTNGVKLNGVLAQTNAMSFKLTRNGRMQKVMWHALATMMEDETSLDVEDANYNR